VSAPVAAPPPAPTRADGGDVRIRYVERSAIRVGGSLTGRVYEFSAAAPTQAVDRRDAAALLASRFFRTTP
jgi:hypothetical protein